MVALRKESVDRNSQISTALLPMLSVALRKESVDRNRIFAYGRRITRKSLSARRAWIEILYCPFGTTVSSVALRKESVDRNCDDEHTEWSDLRRSPQGERG